MIGEFLATLFKGKTGTTERAEHGHASGSSTSEDRNQPEDPPDLEIDRPKAEPEIAHAVIDFGSLVVRQVAVPRTEIIAIEAGALLPEVVQVIADHAISKIPVYEETLDRIIGILHLRDLLAAVTPTLADRTAPIPLRTARDLAREALFVPETISANDLLRQFRARRTHLAIVLDEFGGTAGLVTLEDLLEELIGDVRDPFDVAPPPIQTLPDGSALIDGLMLIEEINTHFNLRLADPNYDTIAGLILGKLGRIPNAGESVEDPENSVCLKVETMDHLRISQIRLTRL